MLILKGILPYLEQLLEVPGKDIKNLVYFNAYIVLDRGNSTVLKNKQILDHKADPELINQILDEIIQGGEEKVSPNVLKKAQELQVQDGLAEQTKKQIQTELNKVKKSLNLEEKNEKKKVNLQKKEAELQEELRKTKLKVVFLEDYLDFLRKH